MDKKVICKFIGWVYNMPELSLIKVEKNHTTVRISDFTDQRQRRFHCNHPLPVVKKTTSFGNGAKWTTKTFLGGV